MVFQFSPLDCMGLPGHWEHLRYAFFERLVLKNTLNKIWLYTYCFYYKSNNLKKQRKNDVKNYGKFTKNAVKNVCLLS